MYFAASFKNPSTGVIDISADGSNIIVIDNSNYRNYTDTALAGGASTISLPTSASSYDDYYNGMEASILAGLGVGEHNIITDYNGTTRVATVATPWIAGVDDTSIFEIGEPGHLKEYFVDFRKVNIVCPDSTEYLFSSIADGDATTLPAATATLPITDTYAYTTGDGVYNITLYTLPTWDATIAYYFIRNVYVYYLTVMYKLLKNDTGTTPGTDATVWEVVSSIDDLPAKYRQNVRFAITCDITSCYRNFVLTADARLKCTMCNKEIWMRDTDVQKSMQLFMIIEAVPTLMYMGLYDDAQTTINKGKQLCCCE